MYLSKDFIFCVPHMTHNSPLWNSNRHIFHINKGGSWQFDNSNGISMFLFYSLVLLHNDMQYAHIAVSMIHWPNTGSMLSQHLRFCSNIEPVLGQCLMSIAGKRCLIYLPSWRSSNEQPQIDITWQVLHSNTSGVDNLQGRVCLHHVTPRCA